MDVMLLHHKREPYSRLDICKMFIYIIYIIDVSHHIDMRINSSHNNGEDR